LKKFQKPFDRKKWSLHSAQKEGITVKEVLQNWQKKSDDANAFGTKIHEFAERHSLVKMGKQTNDFHPILPREAEYRNGILKFWYEHNELSPVAVEKRICVPHWLLGGTVDLICKSHDDHYYLVDWKTSSQIETFSKYCQQMLNPLEHLDDCNFNGYALQLSLYRYMLENRYGFKFHKNFLIHLQPNDYDEYETPYLKKEIERLIELRLETIQRNKNVQQIPTRDELPGEGRTI